MKNENKDSHSRKLKEFCRANGIGLLAYFLATVFTNAHFLGDTVDYVESIVSYNKNIYYEFWEFGHVLWRPLGWLLMRVAYPVTSLIAGKDSRANATVVLMALCWLAGLASVLALAAILRRFCLRSWLINVTLFAFILSHGFLNYAQTGAPYIVSVALLLAGLYVLLRKEKGAGLTTRDGVVTGVAMAAMICFWFPFVVAVPAILCAPLIFSTPTSEKIKIVVGAAVVGGVLVCAVYAAVVIGGVGTHTVSGLRNWMQQTTGQSVQDKGLARTVFGFSRSLIYMGNDGMLFKRYLVHDPYNPVSALDLLRLSFWKMILFYLFVGSILLNLTRSNEGRRLLVLFAINAVPAIGFAVYWQGGDIERYLALYPALFLAFGYSLCSERALRALNYMALLFVMAMAITNARAMSLPVLNREQEAETSRIRDLIPLLKPPSRVYVVNLQDELLNFNRSFPFNPINRGGLAVNGLIEVGRKMVPQWRQDFAVRAQSAWDHGGDVWVTRRVLSPGPAANWNWVEGDDRRASWNDLYTFFAQLQQGKNVGGDDGFVNILPSEENQKFLRSFASKVNSGQ
jgi:hypothetical protein